MMAYLNFKVSSNIMILDANMVLTRVLNFPKYRIFDLSNITRSTNFAMLQAASSVNHSAKLFRRNQLA
jgi:hypothetical protein